MKKNIFPGAAAAFLFLLLRFPTTSFTYAKAGLLMWFQTLLPSLLPFMIISNLFIAASIFDKIPRLLTRALGWLAGLGQSGVYALIMGLFCGYPMGAKVTADLYRGQKLSRREAQYLLTFSNCASPAFLSSFVLGQALNQTKLMGISFVIYYLANFLTSLIFRPILKPTALKTPLQKREEKTAISWITAVDTAIMDGFSSITRLGGYIILFSIISGMAREILPDFGLAKDLFLGTTEITTGITVLANSGGSFLFRYIASMGLTAFGGLCILAQTKSMLQGTDLSLWPYLIAKCCNMCLTVLLCLLLV